MSRWTDNSTRHAKSHAMTSKPTVPKRIARTSSENSSRTQGFEAGSGDDLHKARQNAGLAALVRIAEQTAATVPAEEFPTNPDAFSSPSNPGTGRRRLHDAQRQKASSSSASRWYSSRLANLRADHLVRNSLYLVFSSGVQASLGFAFWIIMARLYSTKDVGIASSLISATAFISYFALFGLNSTLIRFLPTARDKGSLITAAIALVAAAGSIIGLAYVLLTPVFAPRLAFVAHSPALAAAFVLLAAAAAVNLLTDSVFDRVA